MTRTTLDRPERLAFKTLAFKTADTAEAVVSDPIEVREDEGVVTAVVSVTGVIDEVDDIIEPGAYRETLTKRKPKVCWHHSWESPIGRVLHIEELHPGDSRLPTKTRDGKAWPREAGALIATMQFNMKSDRGREAFEAVRFYSESGECEWSIGYQVPPGKATKDAKGVRRIKALELYELSFVLFGAHTMTGTLSLKAAVDVMRQHERAAEITLDEIKATLDRLGIEHKDAAKPDDEDEPQDEPEDEAEPQDAPPVDQGATPPADTPPADGVSSDPDVLFDADEADPDALLDGLDDDEFDAETQVPDDAAMIEPNVDDDEDDLPLTPVEPEVKRKLNAEQRRRKPTLPGSDDRFPIGDREDLRAAISAYGRASDEDKPKVKRWIIRRARELDAVSMLPDDWNVSKSLTGDADTVTVAEAVRRTAQESLRLAQEGKAEGGADRNRGNAEELRRYWTVGAGGAKIRWGTPGDFTRCVRLVSEHMDPERAKGYCANRHKEMNGMWPGDRDNTGDGKALDTTARDPGENLPPGDDPENTGVMVAVYPDPEAAEQIAVRGGLDPEELHVTLAFMGDVTDAAGNGRDLGNSMDAIMAAATSAAATHKPMKGSVGGIGKFPDTGDGVPVWAPVDVVGLNALREAVVDALTTAGLPVKTDHGFTPHMTLGYNLDPALIGEVNDVPVTFDHIAVVVGDAKARIPLGTDVDMGDRGNAEPPTAPGDAPKDAGVKVTRYDPAIEVGPHAGHKTAASAAQGAPERKGFPRLEGTYEERQQRLEQALDEALCPRQESGPDGEVSARHHLSIEGTYPDRVICTVHDWSGPVDNDESYEVAYRIDDEGTVHLGEPERVTLTVTAVGEDGDDEDDVPVGDLLPLSEMVENVANAFKAMPATEVKAGRVLSASNAQRLKSAVEHLIHVLAAAGVNVEADDAKTPPSPVVDDSTTAPSARDNEGKGADVDDDPVEIDLSQHKALIADLDAFTT